MYFPSKKDLWLSITYWLCALFFIIPPIFFPNFGVWISPSFLDKQWIKIFTLSLIGLCLLWIWLKTGYTIKSDVLTIQYGPFRWTIKIAEIHSVTETKNPFTAPALSIDKLEINYGKFKTIAISPKNKTEFIDQLRKQNLNISTDKING